MHFNRRETAALCAALSLLKSTSTLPDSINVIYTSGDQLMPLDGDEILDLRDRIADSNVNAKQLPPKSPAALLQMLERRFGEAFDDDEEIDGGDAVEWLGEFLPLVRASIEAAPTKDQQANTDFYLARTLASAGFYAGPRDPSRNKNYPGAFMVAESLDVADTANAGTGGYCIVGDDLGELMREAVEHHGFAS